MPHYELLEVLGEGGMGRVYRAVHHPSGMEVAVKALHPDTKRDRFRRRLLLDEATAAAKLDHPRVVRMLDVGRDDDGTPFLVMELASGAPLDRLLAPWCGFRVLGRALLSVLDGLAVAHAAGVVHRDLKPGNVIVDPASGAARILDFGVATLLDPLRERESGVIVGTPEFMPPEQLSGDGPIGPWTDLYAFGVMLSAVVRGGSPFGGYDSLTALLVAKGKHVPEPAPPVRPGLVVPRGMQDLIERLLRPHPRARPRFAVEVAAELSALLHEVVDRVASGGVSLERPDSVQPTTVDPSLDEREEDQARSTDLDLPTRLPAVADAALGAGIARLREIPLVGRAEERAELSAMIEEVVERGGTRLCAYVGEAGIGKSRIARWGLAFVEQTGTMEGAAGAYDPSGADVAGGLRHALRRLVGMPARGVAEAWRWLAAEPGLDIERLARFLRADENEDTLAADAVVQLAGTALRAAGRMRPIYLWLDDLGWARDGAIDLVEALLDRDDVPILIVATMRAGSIQHPLVRARLERILRHPRARRRDVIELGIEERARLIEHVAPLAAGVARTLAERIAGSPLLLVQLVHDWRARGLLEPHGATYRPRGGASVDELLVERPLAALFTDRVEDLLAAFGDARDEAEAVLGRAALLGARFEQHALRAACARDPRLAAAVDEVLDRALLVGLLRAEGGHVYAFDHGLVQEALVERIESGAQRVPALVDAANGLLARYGKERADIAALVAGLLHRAGDREHAWERQLRAIERAAWAGDDFAASNYLSVARTWLVSEPQHAGRLEHAEARVHYFALRYDRALDHVSRARALAAGDDALTMICDASEADILFYQDRFADAQRIAERCFAASVSEDPEHAFIRERVSQRLAELAVLRGDLEAALAWRVHTSASAEATGRSWRVRVARLNEAEILAVLGRTAEAITLCDAVLADAKADRDQEHVIAARDTRAQIDVLIGEGARVRSSVDARVAELEAQSDTWRLSGVSATAALLAAELDRDETIVEARVRQLVTAFRAVPHDEAFTLAAMRRLATALEERGRFDLAREVDALLESCAARYRAGFASSR